MANNIKTLGNIIRVSYDYGPSSGVTATESVESNLVNLNLYYPSLYLKQLSSNKVVGQDDVISFAILTLNDGDITLTGITFRDELDLNLTLIKKSIKVILRDTSTSPATEIILPYTLTQNGNTWDISTSASIKPSQEVLLTLSAHSSSSVVLNTQISNTVKAGFSYIDPVQGEIFVDPESGPKDTIIITVKQAKLNLLKDIQSVSGHVASGISIESANNGDWVAYVIEIGNIGNVTAINVKGIDLLPDELFVPFPTGISITPSTPCFTYMLDTNHLFSFSDLTIPMAFSTTPIVIPSSVQIQIIGQVRF